MKIFFDLDGTLIDVAPRHYQVYSEVITELGRTPLAQSVYWRLKRDKTAWPVVLQKTGLNPSDTPRFLEHFIRRIEAVECLRMDTLFPNALSTVDSLKKQYSCYLVSLRRHRNAFEAQLNWLGLRPHFAAVLSGHSERDGSDVKGAIIRRHLGHESGAIIGDTEADILSGKAEGLTTIAMTTGIRSEELLRGLQPDYVLDDISEVAGLLEHHKQTSQHEHRSD
jgi:phosphoglycolate phosphatase